MFTAFLGAVALSTAPVATQPVTRQQIADSDFDRSYAGEIAARFLRGNAPTREQALGWFSGRCYATANPNVASGNLLVVDTRVGQGNNGPIFDRPITKYLVVGRGANGVQAPPEFYDNMTPTVQAETMNFVDQRVADPSLSEAFFESDSYVSQHLPSATRLETRTDSQYFYTRLQNTRTGAYEFFCYFFKKVL